MRFLLLALVLAAGVSAAVVRDSSGAPVPGARIEIAGDTAVLFDAAADATGAFDWPELPSGRYRLRVTAPGLAPRNEVFDPERAPGELTLHPDSVRSEVAVTAIRGTVEEAPASVYLTATVEREQLLSRPLPTIGNALEQLPGILVQQSTSAQVSPFLRGLTGYQVLNLIDGVRFNNSTFRSGPNQYLAFIEPSHAQRVEAILGPAGTQYGSDALGGAIHIATHESRFTAPHLQTHGEFTAAGATGDFSSAGSARATISSERAFLLFGASGRRHNDLRAGQGYDSRNVFNRLFGIRLHQLDPAAGARQQDSGFSQYGLQAKLALRLRPAQFATIYYQRGVQHGVRAYKDLLGGLGRLQSAFAPQHLNWLHGRYEKLAVGFVDSLSATASLNSQTDGSVRQNLHATDPITTDRNRVNAYGYTVQATTHRDTRLLATFGADVYDEHIRSARDVLNPRTGAITRSRPQYPDRSRYTNPGVFAQASYELTSHLRASAGIRFTGVRFATVSEPDFGVPGLSQWFRDTTFHTSLRWQAAGPFGLHAVVSRGFRAPNLNDLGALGLNDLGFEIPASDAIPGGALLSTSGGEGALPAGARLRPLRPESLMNYEFGARFTIRRLYARVQLFDAELHNPIVRRTLLFTSAPAQLAGLPVTAIAPTPAQRAAGVVTVATSLDPRAVKAFVNDGRARYYGVESLVRYSFAPRWSLEANYSFLAGRELDPNRNIRRLPPQTGAATLRYIPSGRRPWFEISLAAAGSQDRLSGGDIDDERIGASRRRRDIADFFAGSRVQPLVDPAGVFTPTGETLLQIQSRVLPGVDDNTRVPLYSSTAGWATLAIRSGIPFGERWQALAAVENLLDRNYRVHGSGVDAPGATAYLSIAYRF